LGDGEVFALVVDDDVPAMRFSIRMLDDEAESYVSCRNARPRVAVESFFDTWSGKYRVDELYRGAETLRSRLAYGSVMFIPLVEFPNTKLRLLLRLCNIECTVSLTR